MGKFLTPTRHGFILPPPKMSLLDVMAQMKEEEVRELLEGFDDGDIEDIENSWQFKARREQLPPPNKSPDDPWTIWLINAGRGFGKTLTGTNYIQHRHRLAATEGRQFRSSIVVPTNSDIEKVIIDGETGFLAQNRGDFALKDSNINKSANKITWPDGSLTFMFSAEQPERMRGPQFELVWLDEFAAMAQRQDLAEADEKLDYIWGMIRFGLRLGKPEMLITTTPKPRKKMRELISDSFKEKDHPERKYAVALTRGSTYDNKENLAESFLDELEREYGGTRLGKQELEAQVLADFSGGLWNTKMFDQGRVKRVPCDLKKILVSVDPAMSSTQKSDEHGIIVAGLGEDGEAYVLGDFSMKGKPRAWAKKVLQAFDEYECDLIVAEKNQGGDLVERNIHSEREGVPIKLVTATKGKIVRAEPVALRYEQRKVHHVGEFVELEEQLCKMAPGKMKKSPDRADALVWAISELLLPKRKRVGSWGRRL